MYIKKISNVGFIFIIPTLCPAKKSAILIVEYAKGNTKYEQIFASGEKRLTAKTKAIPPAKSGVSTKMVKIFVINDQRENTPKYKATIGAVNT